MQANYHEDATKTRQGRATPWRAQAACENRLRLVVVALVVVVAIIITTTITSTTITNYYYFVYYNTNQY